jgi:hypothetical protein
MKKGCIAALIVVGILVIGCCGGLYFLATSYGTPVLIMVVEQSIKEYRELYPDRKVETSNAAWFKALTASDSNIKTKPQLLQIFPNGEFVDLHQTPLKLVQKPDGSIAAISAGKDKKFDTPDDETSDKLMKFIEKSSGS